MICQRLKHCPAWRVIRRETIRAMYRDGLRLRKIAIAWNLPNVASVINQIGDEYVARHEPNYIKRLVATAFGVRKEYEPMKDCVADGYVLSMVYRALSSGKPYKGLYWERVE